MEQFLGLPPDGSAHGPAIDHLIAIVHWLMLILFVGWGSYYVYALFRFRKSKHPTANYAGVKSHFTNYVEVGVLIAEIILLAAFSIPLWSKRVDAFPSESAATVVRVIGEQFAWNIHYAGPDGKFGRSSIELINADNPLGLDRSDPDAKDDIVTNNTLFLPVNKPVIVHLTSKDVIHSFNLPAYRVKQDAIPGMEIPLWFTPIKTTDQLREELRHSFSIREAMSKVRTVKLPPMARMPVTKGPAHDDMMVVQDYKDSTGTIVAKGDRLTAENVAKLDGAGIAEVTARPVANLDKFISMEEHKDSAGAPMISMNDQLSEETVTKLVEAGVTQISVRPAANMDTFVVMEAYTDKSGAPIANKGDALLDSVITKLGQAGIPQVVLAPATPTEIACAQLCGLGHYRMRGYVTVQTPDEFKKWYDEQEAALTQTSGGEQPPVQADSSREAGRVTPAGQAAKSGKKH